MDGWMYKVIDSYMDEGTDPSDDFLPFPSHFLQDEDAPRAKWPGATKSIELKVEKLREHICKQIASCAASFDFSSNKATNEPAEQELATLGPHHYLLQVRESSAFTGT